MSITAKVIEDSISPSKSRLTTMVLSYPRWIHSEFMTHRVFSRNAASSRAIPVATMIDRAVNHTAMPVYWGKNQKGMQAAEEISADAQFFATKLWKEAAQSAANYALKLQELGVHKQITNRLIENFQNIEVVVTSTKWANFYALRNHPDAQPEIKTLAAEMVKAHRASVPKALSEYDWHLPFVTPAERSALTDIIACRVSAARCARVSYLKHDGTTPSLGDDLELFNRLVARDIKHASPTEHQARPKRYFSGMDDRDLYILTGNFGSDWVQFRKTLEGENIQSYEEFTR